MSLDHVLGGLALLATIVAVALIGAALQKVSRRLLALARGHRVLRKQA
jgi:hypothetical protein